MTNTNLLKGRIMAKGFTVKKMAEAIGISHTSMSYKINNRREFTVSEIQKICDKLEITNKDPYFFNQKVDGMAT